MNLKSRILFPLSFALIIFLIVLVITFKEYHFGSVVDVVEETSQTLQRLLDEELKAESDFMLEVIEMLEDDDDLKRALREENRELLIEKTEKHFKRLHDEHGITHFYFTNPERINILRLHKKDRFGDKINRVTTMKAKRTGQPSYGIELGPLGTFTLRTVVPWYMNNRLIGFVELGKEIEHIINKLNQVTKTDLVVLIDKLNVDRDGWTSGMEMLNRDANWDLLPSAVIAYETKILDWQRLWPIFSERRRGPAGELLQITADKREYLCRFLPLIDANNVKVGDIVVLHDITEHNRSAAHATLINSTVGISLAGLLMFMFYVISSKAEKKLATSQKKLFFESNRRQAMQEEYIRELEHLALHDSLTGLPNRTLLHNRLNQRIAQCKQSQQTREQLTLMAISINRFREIGDTLGHKNGDLLLNKISNCLKKEFHESDTIARMGSNMLGIMLMNIAREDVPKLVQRTEKCINMPFLINNFNLNIDVSIGIIIYPDHGNDAETLIQRADVANRLAKHDHSSYAIYDAERDPHSLQRLSFMTDLKRAVEMDELILHYQPKVDLKTGRISGVEALVRWRHPQYGLISPDDFIPMAEDTGVIHPLTYWVLEKALQQHKKWNKMGLYIKVSVNISARSLQNPRFQEEVKELLKVTGVEAACLTMEVTESAIMTDPQDATEMLSIIEGMGISISIDDFGTGYSSLSYLSKLPVKELKIDKSFVSGIKENNNDIIIVRSTIDLGRNLGLKIIAEGVEDKDVCERLATLGCDVIQGYYISHPLPPDEFSDWLKRSEWNLKKIEGKNFF